jgi:hypothetical protein
LSPDSKKDENGNWKPEDMWFYVPGETPPEDSWKPQGVWTYPPNKLKVDWPPPTDDEEKKLLDVGKLPKFKPKGQADDWKPQGAWVFPKESAPENPDDSKPQGIWKHEAGQKPDDEDEWEPLEVWIYPPGEEPNDLDDSKPCGVWGLAPGAEPDDDGDWKADDIWFYAPGEDPPDDDDWAPQGVWTSPPDKLDYDWPPPKKDASKNAPKPGKLKIPTFGKNEEKHLRSVRKLQISEFDKKKRDKPVGFSVVKPRSSTEQSDDSPPLPLNRRGSSFMVVSGKESTMVEAPGKNPKALLMHSTATDTPPQDRDRMRPPDMSNWKNPFEYTPKPKDKRKSKKP